MLTAITRPVSDSLARCELTHLARQPIDLASARQQHAAYEALLERLGVRVIRMPPAHDLPDAVFIEDTAVVLDELAVITQPGAASRVAEISAVATTLTPLRRLARIQMPGTLDGGDVLVLGKQIFVGRSSRSNDEGVRQLLEHVRPFGYTVETVPVRGCLHLKSAATAIADDTLLINPAWLPPGAFPGIQHIEIDPAEPAAANALRIGDTLIHAAEFPRTQARLRNRRFAIAALQYDELAKAEGAVTCCSLVFEAR